MEKQTVVKKRRKRGQTEDSGNPFLTPWDEDGYELIRIEHSSGERWTVRKKIESEKTE